MGSDKLGVTFTFGHTKAGTSTRVKRVNKDIPSEAVHDFGDQIFAMLWHCWEAVQLGPLYLCTPERILISALAACESSESKSDAETAAIAAAVFARSQDRTDGNWGEEAKLTEEAIQAAAEKDAATETHAYKENPSPLTDNGIIMVISQADRAMLDNILYSVALDLDVGEAELLVPLGKDSFAAVQAWIKGFRKALAAPEGCQDG
jgi:hypothetical protein